MTLIETEFLVGEEAHQLCYGAAMKGVGGDGINADEIDRLREWAINVRHEAMLLDDIVAGRALVRWPAGSRGPVLYPAPA